MKKVFALLLLSLNGALAYAGIPKFSIIPITPFKGQIALNGVVNVDYIVTNNTEFPRTLTMQPIVGVTQITSFPLACSNPFFLSHNKSCTLRLQIIAAETYDGVHSNIVVCKTMGPGDNRPDPFLCSQTTQGQSLQFTLGPSNNR